MEKQLLHDIVDGFVVSPGELADIQRDARSHSGHFFPRLGRMDQRFGRLFAHPAHNRNSSMSEHHQRILRVADRSRQLQLHNPVENFDRFGFVEFHDINLRQRDVVIEPASQTYVLCDCYHRSAFKLKRAIALPAGRDHL